MGSMARLKKKDELNYRKGSTNEAANCRFCVNFVANYEATGIGGEVLRTESRCHLMGVDHSSVRYRIRPDFTCNAQKYDQTMRPSSCF